MNWVKSCAWYCHYEYFYTKRNFLMCGFAGYLSADIPNNVVELLQRMGDTIAHHGPDDSGIWCDNEAGISLVHRRLAGHQPMLSGSERYVIAFNGEIYNHLTLRCS